jgi:hypothetical protein
MAATSSRLKSVAIVFSVLLALVIAAALVGVGAMAIVFALVPARQSTSCEIMIVVLDSDGQPLRDLPVELWGYDKRTQHATTNARGEAVFSNQTFDYSRTILSPRHNRPDGFEVRARFPELTDLYYRWRVKKSGESEYELFDDSYDFYFGGHWLGRFRGDNQVLREITEQGKTHGAKPLGPGHMPLTFWNSTSTLEPSATGPEVWSLRIELRAVAK